MSNGRAVGSPAGSDWSVSSLNPLDAIEVAVRRQNPDASPEEELPVLNAEERVDLGAMIEAYTINGAYLMRQEEQRRQHRSRQASRPDRPRSRTCLRFGPHQINEAT